VTEFSDTPSRNASAFDLLAEGIQRQLYGMGWRELREIQASAIRVILQTDQDLLIMAETAGGKTEAAFLPLLSAISSEPEGSVRAIYVGPLKALINDQFGRLEDLCSHLDLKVHRWHGDVPASHKAALIKEPSGILLITPESLESLLINRTPFLGSLFGGLRAVVIDEVHAFLEGERGTHLASLLSRVLRYVKPDQPRTRIIGLSATVGDADVARRYLSPDVPQRVAIVTDDGSGKEIQLRIHGFVKEVAPSGAQSLEGDEEDLRVMQQVAADLVEHCRSHSNLVFANSKADIEIYADLANETCRQDGLAETFLVHHGSLAKDVREDAEATMKSGRCMTTVCSSTLEMGIDIGSVRMVGQIGPPWSVSSFKQRLGRGGRKDGEPRRLRGYVICDAVDSEADPLSRLPIDLVQTIAVCDLMLRKWVEPPSPSKLDLSTLSQQVISVIAELGAVDAESLFDQLCCKGPFRHFPKSLFIRVLRELGKADVIEQGSDGNLMLGLEGERIRKKKDFYAAFASRTEFSLVAGDRLLGTLPMDSVPAIGEHLVFAARRWRVVDVDALKLSIYVVSATRRQPPRFTGGIGDVHTRVREEMLAVFASDVEPAFLDTTARQVLQDARRIVREHDFARRRLVSYGESKTLWLTWTGTKHQRSLIALLAVMGVEAFDREIAIECRAPMTELRDRLRASRSVLPSGLALANMVAPKGYRKYDYLFSPGLLDEAIAVDRLDPIGSAIDSIG